MSRLRPRNGSSAVIVPLVLLLQWAEAIFSG
jgi:hypothetical protein